MNAILDASLNHAMQKPRGYQNKCKLGWNPQTLAPFLQSDIRWHIAIVLLSACRRGDVGFAIMLGRKFLVSAGVHNHIPTVSDTLHD